jgi:tetratricopeptide (TPR) repeat protein
VTLNRAGVALTLVLLVWAAATPVRAALTAAARLAAVYDAVLSADFDRAERLRREACPPAPSEACQVMAAVALWWEIQLHPESRQLDARFSTLATQAVAAADAWTRREPQRAEAWFYLAGSYAPLVQWRILRGERITAAREGNRIRSALERALALDPALHDAHFGIGLYHYYADVAPPAAQLVRMLLLLPGGDRVKGLQEMSQARDLGQLLRGEADYQLHFIYLWYEKKAGLALDLLKGLDARYPSNPLFLQEIAKLHADTLGHHDASAAAWRTLLTRAQKGTVHRARLAEVRARLGLAAALDAQRQTDLAIEQLEAVVSAKPTEPADGLARAHLQLGVAFDRLGRRDRAAAAYQQAIALAPADDPSRIRERARAGLRAASKK